MLLDNLTQDEKEKLNDLVADGDGWRLMLKLVENCVQAQRNQVLDYNLNKGADGLALEKARLEGAQAIRRALGSLKDARKPKGNKRRP